MGINHPALEVQLGLVPGQVGLQRRSVSDLSGLPRHQLSRLLWLSACHCSCELDIFGISEMHDMHSYAFITGFIVMIHVNGFRVWGSNHLLRRSLHPLPNPAKLHDQKVQLDPQSTNNRVQTIHLRSTPPL